MPIMLHANFTLSVPMSTFAVTPCHIPPTQRCIYEFRHRKKCVPLMCFAEGWPTWRKCAITQSPHLKKRIESTRNQNEVFVYFFFLFFSPFYDYTYQLIIIINNKFCCSCTYSQIYTVVIPILLNLETIYRSHFFSCPVAINS